MNIVRALIALVVSAATVTAADDGNWFSFEPTNDPLTIGSPITLRGLNEKFAGEHGVIASKGGQFVHHTYSDRSSLRFDPGEPGKSKQFVHPVMDPHYADKPSMISKTTFTRPNRFRSEAALYFAAYGALQDSDCIVHFAFDGADWKVKPRFWISTVNPPEPPGLHRKSNSSPRHCTT